VYVSRRKAQAVDRARQIIVVSDLHCGCQLGLCPPPEVHKVPLDGGGWYEPSDLQRKVWAWWEEFWHEWVPSQTRGEPYGVVINGDAIEGAHHRAKTPITTNFADQIALAKTVLLPVLTGVAAAWMVRGTEAHVGECAENEELLSQQLPVRKTEHGRGTRIELRLRVGDALVDIQHHIAATGSSAFETTALQREFVIACEEAGRWGREPPDVLIRAHRHRAAKTEVPTRKGSGIVLTTPGWQLKTPYAYRLPGGRQSYPQFGGVLVRHGDEHIYTKHRVWDIDRSPVEEL
jgi:hypothetical protein